MEHIGRGVKGKLSEQEKKERTWLFQKGVSGNPNGRPKKGKAFADILEKELENTKIELTNKNGETQTVDAKTLMIKTLIRMALYSEDENIKFKCIDRIWDRRDGTPVQQVLMDAEVTNNNSVFDSIDVSNLTTKQKENLEDVLKSMYQGEE